MPHDEDAIEVDAARGAHRCHDRFHERDVTLGVDAVAWVAPRERAGARRQRAWVDDDGLR